jgi:tetratricopeptide (TPR) repeat protein
MQGDAASALQSYRQAQAVLLRVAVADPQNAQAGVELASARARAGYALSREGNTSGGVAMLRSTVAMLEPLAHDPGHTQARAELARSHIWMRDLLAATGRPSAALENYRKGIADFVAVTSVLPWHRYNLSRLAASHGKVGSVLAKMGQSREAVAEYESALEIAKPLALANPKNPLPWYTIAETYSGLGDLSRATVARSKGNLQKEQQNWTEAREWYQHSVEA